MPRPPKSYEKRKRSSKSTPRRASRIPGTRVVTKIPKSIGSTNVSRIWPGRQDGPYNFTFDPTPGKLRVTLRYSQTLNMANSVAGTIESYLFRANSIFDPDYTGVGHQPIGHDQWMAFYRRYKVTDSTIVVTPLKTDDTNLGLIGITQEATASVSVDFDSVLEQKSVRVLNMKNCTAPNVQMSWNNNYLDKDIDGQSAVFGANPSSSSFFRLFLRSARNNTVSTCTALVSITYNVELSEPEDLAQS